LQPNFAASSVSSKQPGAGVSKKEIEGLTFYRRLADNLPQIVWYSRPDGFMFYFNRRWFEYTGRTREQTLGWGWREAIHQDDRSQVLDHLSSAMSSDIVGQLEYRLKRADGKYRWHIGRTSAQFHCNGQILRRFGTSTDIDDDRRSEEMRRQAETQETVGRLASGVAHDFNNLLTVIMMGSSFAMDSLPKAHPARNTLDIVLRSSKRAARLTCELLAYSRKGGVVTQPVNLSYLVQRLEGSVRSSVPGSMHLDIEVDPNLPCVQADLNQMEVMIENVVMNACEAIGNEHEGAIRLRTVIQELDTQLIRDRFPRFELNPGTYVSLEVIDTGCGMDENTISRIFEPFFTTKLMGRGLGLAAVDGIVRRHRGAIQVESTPGSGAVLRILLPAAPASHATLMAQ
jgi:PAS domain S-box-containing protein